MKTINGMKTVGYLHENLATLFKEIFPGLRIFLQGLPQIVLNVVLAFVRISLGYDGFFQNTLIISQMSQELRMLSEVPCHSLLKGHDDCWVFPQLSEMLLSPQKWRGPIGHAQPGDCLVTAKKNLFCSRDDIPSTENCYINQNCLLTSSLKESFLDAIASRSTFPCQW